MKVDKIIGRSGYALLCIGLGALAYKLGGIIATIIMVGIYLRLITKK
jgi:hypothetical protein